MNSPLVIGVLTVFAIGMATTTAITIKWTVMVTGPLSAGTVEFVLAMMAGMFVGVLVYFAEGGTAGIVAGFWVAAVIMSASVFIVFVGFLREMRTPSTAPPRPEFRGAFVVSVIALVLANECLMGWSFGLISGTFPVPFGSTPDRIFEVATSAVTSPWFVFPMALEMALSLLFLLPRFPREMRPYLLVQPAIMVCSPPTLTGLPWLLGSALVGSGLMAVAVAWLLLGLVRGQDLPPPVTRYLLWLFASFALMAAGLYAWVEFSNSGVFALALVAQMLVFLRAVTEPDHFGSSPVATPGAAPVPATP